MLCAIAKIDDAARVRLDVLCKIAEEFNLPARHLYGHITLATYIGADEAWFIGQCKAALAGQRPFSVLYKRIETMPPTPTVVALPDMSPELSAIHARLIEAAPADLDSWSSKELWRPHTTLFYHAEADLNAISQRMKECFAPFAAEVSKIEFSRVTDGGYEIVDAVDLRATAGRER